jgi:hypothetical protein
MWYFGPNLVVGMISAIQESKLVNLGKKGWKTREGIRKSICLVEHYTYKKSVDKANWHLSYYSVLRKTIKWFKNINLYLLNCCTLQRFFCLHNFKQKSKCKIKSFCIRLRRCALLNCITQLGPVKAMLDLNWRNDHHGEPNRTLHVIIRGF